MTMKNKQFCCGYGELAHNSLRFKESHMYVNLCSVLFAGKENRTRRPRRLVLPENLSVFSTFLHRETAVSLTHFPSSVLHLEKLLRNFAGKENRTPVCCLGSNHSATKPYPLKIKTSFLSNARFWRKNRYCLSRRLS